MENFLLVNFGEIWPKTLYYSTGSLARFWSNFKNSILIGTNCTGQDCVFVLLINWAKPSVMKSICLYGQLSNYY